MSTIDTVAVGYAMAGIGNAMAAGCPVATKLATKLATFLPLALAGDAHAIEEVIALAFDLAVSQD